MASRGQAGDVTMPVERTLDRPGHDRVRSPRTLTGRRIPALLAASCGLLAAGLCIVAAYFVFTSIEQRFLMFWAGMATLVITCAWALWFRRFSAGVQVGILAAAGIVSYLPKLFRSYDYPAYADELVHLGQAKLLESGILFGHNSVDPVAGYFPVYQMLVVGVHLTTPLSLWASSLFVAGAGHVGQLLGVYLLVTHISASRRIGGMAAVLWLAGPAVLFWMSEASYQTVALAFAFLTVYACLRAVDGANPRTWIPAAIIGMVATTTTQAVAGLSVAAFLFVLAACDVSGGLVAAIRRGTGWKPSSLFAFGFASVAINLGWIAAIGWETTWSYLLPPWGTVQLGLSEILNFPSHREPFRGSGLPLYEQYAGYAALALTVLALAVALFLYVRGRLQPDLSRPARRGITASFVLAALFVLPMPFVLSVETAIWVHRAQELVWVGVCLVLAFLLRWLIAAGRRRGVWQRRLAVAAATGFAVVLMVGNTATTAPSDARFRLPYTFGRGAGMVTADQLAASRWLAEHHAGARIATDPDTAYVQWAYGGATWVSDRFPAWELTFGYPIGGDAESAVKRFDVQFLVIDMEMYREASVGHIYSNQEPDAYAGKPLPYIAYQRLLAVPWVRVAYSNSQISILELTPPRGPGP